MSDMLLNRTGIPLPSEMKREDNKNNVERLEGLALELSHQADGISNLADEWVTMNSNTLTIDDLRQRAATLRDKSRRLTKQAMAVKK